MARRARVHARTTALAAAMPTLSHSEQHDCPHNRRVQWSLHEFCCLDCHQAFAEQGDGTLTPIPSSAS